MLADREPRVRFTDEPLHILIPRWDGKLGDSIVSSFFIREAHLRLNAKVTVLTVKELADIHTVDFSVDQVLITSQNPGCYELCGLARRIGKVDVVVHMVGRVQPAEILFIRFLRPTLVYSLDDHLRCVNRKVGALTTGLDMADLYKWVLEDLGAGFVNMKYIVPLPNALPINLVSSHILVNSYASRPDKSLGFRCSVSLLRAIADEYSEFSVGILCSPATQEIAEKVKVAVARENVRVIYGLISPKLLAGVLNQADAIVSVDTATVHMAVGLRKKLVAIYPLIEGEKNPWLPPHSPFIRVIFSEQSPDQYMRTGKKNMDAFQVKELLKHLHNLLTEQ